MTGSKQLILSGRVTKPAMSCSASVKRVVISSDEDDQPLLKKRNTKQSSKHTQIRPSSANSTPLGPAVKVLPKSTPAKVPVEASATKQTSISRPPPPKYGRAVTPTKQPASLRSTPKPTTTVTKQWSAPPASDYAIIVPNRKTLYDNLSHLESRRRRMHTQCLAVDDQIAAVQKQLAELQRQYEEKCARVGKVTAQVEEKVGLLGKLRGEVITELAELQSMYAFEDQLRKERLEDFLVCKTFIKSLEGFVEEVKGITSIWKLEGSQQQGLEVSQKERLGKAINTEVDRPFGAVAGTSKVCVDLVRWALWSW